MKLSKRMQAIVDLIAPCDVVADVGCDHGKVAVYLLQNKKAKFVYISDISAPSLQKAKNTLIENSFNNFKAIVSDGFKEYDVTDLQSINTIVIAGMGGQEIVEILIELFKCNIDLQKKFKLVLQPQNNEVLLRKFLIKQKCAIDTDRILQEDAKFYNIVSCETNTKSKLKTKEIYLGKTNLKEVSSDFINWLEHKIKVLEKAKAASRGKFEFKKELKMFQKAYKKLAKTIIKC